MGHVIQANNVCKTFRGGREEVAVIRDVSLQIPRGEFAVVMGSSGSGKSSLLYLLSGIDRPSKGEIHLNGVRIDEMDETRLARLRRKAVGFIFQDFNLIPNLSLLENVMIAGLLHEKNRREVSRRAKELLELVGIANLADRLPSRTSGGEQQRCAIARALINEPDVLLADEPTGNLNSATGEAVMQIFKKIHQRGQTLVMVTHELKTACSGDRVLFMRDGAISDDFSMAEEGGANWDTREKALFDWLSQRGW